jgi:hypothetical protein
MGVLLQELLMEKREPGGILVVEGRKIIGLDKRREMP